MLKKDFKILIEIIILLLVLEFHFISEWFYRYDAIWFFGLRLDSLIVDIVLYLMIGLIIILILLEKREND